MTDKEDKYRDEEEDLTQVRSIIKQLNDGKPSRERRREVVVRADGTKVVRVTKKRKVMVSALEKRHRSRRHFIYTLAGGGVLLLMLVIFLFMRMASMSSSSYMESCRNELQQRWGAVSVQVEGAGVNGTAFHLANVTAEFPESSMIERVEMSGIDANLDWMSFFRSKLQGEELKIDRAVIVLRAGACMNMPQYQGDMLWEFPRVECKELSVQFANGEEAPMMLKNAAAYMYYPHASKMSCVVMINSGSLHIKGWKTVNITESKVHISSRAIEDFTIRGTTDSETDLPEQRRTSIAFAGKIGPDSDFTGPYAVESDNMSLADFTKGRFEEFFTARTRSSSQGRISKLATITLAGEQEEPVFNGEFHLRNVCLSSFPALMSLTEHIEPAKRSLYNPISLHRGRVLIDNHEGVISIELPKGGMEERDLATLVGKIELNASNELSGEMSYGIPMLLARVEYPDGRPDPIFQQNGDWAVLRTRLRGQGNAPEDDMGEVEARAAIARRERPARIPFSQFDIDKMTERLNGSQREQGLFPEASGADDQKNLFLQNDASSNPFETPDNPFVPASPF